MDFSSNKIPKHDQYVPSYDQSQCYDDFNEEAEMDDNEEILKSKTELILHKDFGNPNVESGQSMNAKVWNHRFLETGRFIINIGYMFRGNFFSKELDLKSLHDSELMDIWKRLFYKTPTGDRNEFINFLCESQAKYEVGQEKLKEKADAEAAKTSVLQNVSADDLLANLSPEILAALLQKHKVSEEKALVEKKKEEERIAEALPLSTGAKIGANVGSVVEKGVTNTIEVAKGLLGNK